MVVQVSFPCPEVKEKGDITERTVMTPFIMTTKLTIKEKEKEKEKAKAFEKEKEKEKVKEKVKVLKARIWLRGPRLYSSLPTKSLPKPFQS